MAMEAQRVVVIQDVSRAISWKAIKGVLEGLHLKPNDELTLVGVLHQVNNPSTYSPKELMYQLGYKTKVEATNTKLVEEEVARKKKEYRENPEALELVNHCEVEKIKFRIKVQAGPIPKVVAVDAAKKHKATWIVLDRQMKKDNRYFLDELSCGISRMRSNHVIEHLRVPKAIEGRKSSAEKSYVGYDEMIPESPKMREPAQKSPNSQKIGSSGSRSPSSENPRSSSVSKSPSSSQMSLFSSFSSKTKKEASSSSHELGEISPRKSPDEESTIYSEQMSFDEKSPSSNINPLEQRLMRYGDWVQKSGSDEVFRNSICSGCGNRRPTVDWINFKYKELYAATEGFSPKNFLSEGGFGSVYKGKLKSGLSIAVKKHNNASFQGEKEFKSEVQVLSKTRHTNLVMLLGSCSEGNHRLLVYEFVCNGSLDHHLSGQKGKTLSWERRVKIASGAANGLEYLHRNNIIHRDVSPNNILLTHDHEPLLGDFGLAKTQNTEADNSETKVVGTLGYLAPEYVEYGRASTKSDVYSFGMVLLQLITGLRPTDKIENDKSLIGWARPLLTEKNYPDLIDHRISDCHDMFQMFLMIQVAEECLQEDPKRRWTMEKVVENLKKMISPDEAPTPREMADEGLNNTTPSDEITREINSPPSATLDSLEKDISVSSSGGDDVKIENKSSSSPGSEKSKTVDDNNKSPKQREVFYDEMVV